MMEARRDPLAFTLRLAQQHGPVAKFHLGPFHGFLVSHPEAIGHILQANHKNYDKQNFDYEMLRPFLGNGLLTSDGEHWLRQRRLIQPAFHQDRLSHLIPAMSQSTDKMLNAWELKAHSPRVINISQEMNRLALINVSKNLLGADIGLSSTRILEAFSRLNHAVAHRFQALLPLPLWMPTPNNVAARKAIAVIDEALSDIKIAEREKGSGQGLLGRLVEAHLGTSQGQGGPQQLRDELVTLVLAGHETTAAMLTWTFYLLAQNPDVQEMLRREVNKTTAAAAPDPADLSQLDLTEAVIKEALRLYPPVWIISRRAKEPDQIAGMTIPANSVLVMSPYATHRLPDFWRSPGEFSPERFLGKEVQSLPRFAYFPFGGGPRLCIGANFAMIEAKLVLSSMIKCCQFSLIDDLEIRPEPLVTLRPAPDLRLKVRRVLPS
jgi:cytochrome P450